MSSSPRRHTAPAATAAGALLLVAAPSPAGALRDLASAAEPGDPYVPLVALLSLTAWGLAACLAVGALATAAAHLPGVAGRAGARLARRTAPAAVRRAVEVSLGLSVAVGGVGASPALAAPPASSDPAAPAAATPHLDRTPADPGLDWTPPAPEPPTPAAPQPARVVVRPGDTLWDLAEQDLVERGDAAPSDAQVAQAWPSWWTANRDAVGDDPHLIRPGTHLTPPGDSTPPSS